MGERPTDHDTGVSDPTVSDGVPSELSDQSPDQSPGQTPDDLPGDVLDQLDEAVEHGVEELHDLEDAVEHDIAEVLAERDQFRDIAQRLQADFDNYRKRAATQNADEVDRATGRLAEALLPVLDAAEAAYVRHPDEVGPLLNLMLTELKKHGLESLDLDGHPFDPEVAEAVAHEPADGGEVVVAEVLRSGYRWRGRTLRAAMVRTRD
jgi:molecular chaperone GrpE